MSPTLNFGGIVFAFAVTSFDLPSAPTYRTQTYIMLTLRPTGLSPPVYCDQLDYEVIEDGRSIGRMYEDWHALPDFRGLSAGRDDTWPSADACGSQGTVSRELAKVSQQLDSYR
jgi:hypothetical protein